MGWRFHDKYMGLPTCGKPYLRLTVCKAVNGKEYYQYSLRIIDSIYS